MASLSMTDHIKKLSRSCFFQLRVAKQLVRKNRDEVGAGCVKDNIGKIVVEEDKLLEVWKEHYDRISNEEFSWDKEGLTDLRPVCGPGEKISEEEVEAAIGKMKFGKAGGPRVWWQFNSINKFKKRSLQNVLQRRTKK